MPNECASIGENEMRGARTFDIGPVTAGPVARDVPDRHGFRLEEFADFKQQPIIASSHGRIHPLVERVAQVDHRRPSNPNDRLEKIVRKSVSLPTGLGVDQTTLTSQLPFRAKPKAHLPPMSLMQLAFGALSSARSNSFTVAPCSGEPLKRISTGSCCKPGE